MRLRGIHAGDAAVSGQILSAIPSLGVGFIMELISGLSGNDTLVDLNSKGRMQ
jgi:hypothetical protein